MRQVERHVRNGPTSSSTGRRRLSATIPALAGAHAAPVNCALGISDMLQSADTARDAALRAVGRTVVNFQRLEHNLKLAARLGPLHGTLPKIQKDIARRQERAETLTLGQAIQAWLKYCDGSETQDAWTPDLFDCSVRMTFTLESDDESRRAHAEALSALLEMRNDLVHTRLAHVQWESAEACDALVLELTAVNTVISEQLEYVTSLVREIVAAQKEHAEAVIVNLETAALPPPTSAPDA